MLRIVDISVSPSATDRVLAQLGELEGVIGLRVQRGVGVERPADVIVAQATSIGLRHVLQMLDRGEYFRDASASITTSEPLSIWSPTAGSGVTAGPSYTTLEEMEATLGKESNMTTSGLLLMASAGVIATIGLSFNILHYVIAAMIIAPGFEPIVRIALGVVARSSVWRRGLRDILRGYLALIAGAAATAALLLFAGKGPLGSQSSYLDPGLLISYWMTISWVSLLVDFVGGTAGAILVVTGRSVLTAGVLIAMALIPSAALVAAGLVSMDIELITAGATRWALNVLLALAASFAVLAWNRRSVQRRRLLF